MQIQQRRAIKLIGILLLGIAVVTVYAKIFGSARYEKPELEEFVYKPENCPTDAKGKIYYQVGKRVFAFSEPKARFHFKGKKDDLEQYKRGLGCPTSPIIITGVSISYRQIPENPESQSGPTGFAKWGPTLRTMESRLKGGFTKIDPVTEAQEYCSHTRKVEMGDFKACLHDDSIHHQQDKGLTDIEEAKVATGFYIARNYETPIGKPFIASCANDYGLPADCYVRYQFYDDTFVAYTFQRERIPLDRLIEYDKGVREAIKNAYVKTVD